MVYIIVKAGPELTAQWSLWAGLWAVWSDPCCCSAPLYPDRNTLLDTSAPENSCSHHYLIRMSEEIDGEVEREGEMTEKL